MQDIIDGTHLSRGAFYRYFGSTDEVFLAVVRRVIDTLVTSSKERTGSTLRERVYDGNLRYMRVFEAERGVMRALFEAAFVNPQIAEVQAEMRVAYLRRVRDHLERQVQRARCWPIDVDAATLSLGMMVEGAAQSLFVLPMEPFETHLELERMCRQVTDIWCRAIYRDADLPIE